MLKERVEMEKLCNEKFLQRGYRYEYQHSPFQKLIYTATYTNFTGSYLFTPQLNANVPFACFTSTCVLSNQIPAIKAIVYECHMNGTQNFGV